MIPTNNSSMGRIREFLRQMLRSDSTARRVSILAGGTAISQVLAILITPVLTRLYPAEDFGYFQIYLSFMGFAALVVTLRYELAILLPEQEEVAANVVVATLCAVFSVTVFLGGAAWFVHSRRLLPTKALALQSYLWLIPFAVCGAGVYQTLNYWALRREAYRRVAGTRLTQAVSQLATQLGVGLFHSGPLGLLLGDAVGRVNGSLSLAQLLYRRSWRVFRAVRWRTIWSAASRYRRFPLVSSWSSLLNVGGYSIPPLLMAGLYGPKMLGWFALGDRVLGAPTTLVGQAVSQVYSVKAATLATSDPEALRALFWRSVKQLALLGVVPFAAMLVFSPSLFALAFGESWREAGVYARLLAAMHYLAFMTWPLTQTLNILEQQFWQLAWDTGRVLLTCGSLWMVFRSAGSGRVAIGALGATMFLGYAVFLMLCDWAIKKRIREVRERANNQLSVQPEYAELREL